MFNIQPIVLLHGDHPDVAKTGRGCFMNVISYLEGESPITDCSPTVCPIIRVVAMTLNDDLDHHSRQQLIPFIPRAMNSSRPTLLEILLRHRALNVFTNSVVKLLDTPLGRGHPFRDEIESLRCRVLLSPAPIIAAGAAMSIYRRAKTGLDFYAHAARTSFDKTTTLLGLQLMDAICPPLGTDPPPEVALRAHRLLEMTAG